MSGGDARAELGVRPLLGVSGCWMARLDPNRSCGKDTGVRGAKASPAASNSARTELTCGSDSGAILRTLEPGSGKKGLAR